MSDSSTANNNNSNENDSKETYYSQIRALTDAAPQSLSRVEVNQRALIDKILARYATASAVYRELLQNSNDAGAAAAEIRFSTTAAAAADGKNSNKNASAAAETVTQVVYRNNGVPFRPQDWDRLQKIAEGNPDVSKVGAFGVGAYTMFSVAEEPVIVSGDRVLVFLWKGDALYTQQAKNQNKDSQDNQWTTFLLPSRDPYPLPDWTEFGEFLTAALTFTSALKSITVFVNSVEKLRIVKTVLVPPRPVQAPRDAATTAAATATATSKASFLWNALTSSGSGKTAPSALQSRTGLFSLPVGGGATAADAVVTETLVRVTVTLDRAASAHADARYVTALAATNLPAELRRRMRRVTKKDAPERCAVHVFLNYCHQPPAAQSSHQRATDSDTSATARQQARQLARSLAPAPGRGRIFIGFRTSQTTGLGAHVAAPFVPTVEREAMDLQDPALRQFNSELLEVAGILLRLTLEDALRNRIDAQWRRSQVEREALDRKYRTEWQLERESKKTKQQPRRSGSKPGMVGGATNGAAEPKTEGDAASNNDNDGDDSSTAGGSTTIMSFARFMAKGVKKKMVRGFQTAATLLEGDGGAEHLLLHPPDPRPLSDEEQQAVALMASFCPQQSTPDPVVGACLAQGFSDCWPEQAPPVLTVGGVVSGSEARTPRYGMEQFCNIADDDAANTSNNTNKTGSTAAGVANVVRQVVLDNAEEYHTVLAQCRPLQLDDLMRSVEQSVLSQEKAVTLIQWSARYARIDSRCAAQIKSGRLKDVIRFRKNKSGDVVKLSDYLFFVDNDHAQNAVALRELPLPDTVLPVELQKEIGWTALKSDALLDTWFSPLPMEIWAEFISFHSCTCDGKPEDELLRVKVLTVLSREFMRRPAHERSVAGDFFRTLLGNKRCIPFDSDQPTQFAADFPSELYLHSAELKAFDGVGSFHKVSGALQSAGVTDEFLLAIGVRKSVSIDFLFAHLATLSWNQDPKALIEYLRSATLTRADVHKLSTTRYLPAAHDSARTYAPSELYLPNEDLRLFPFVKMLQWPSETVVSEQSSNGKFLVKLGMKTMPPLSTVLAHLSGSDLTQEQLMAGLDFVCDRLVPHGVYYSQYNAMGFGDKKRFRILPCVVNNPITGESSSERYSPVTCFSSSNCAVMGFPVIDPKLGKNAKLYGSLFQCDSEPPSSYLLNQLVHLETLAKKGQQTKAAATPSSIEATFAAIFKYLSDRSSDLNYSSLNGLSERNFIPTIVNDEIVWYRPDEVFFKRSERGSDSLTEDLFHVIEFSPFLAACGVKEEATTNDLFKKMIAQPDQVLRMLGSEKKYRGLLRRIAADPPFSLSRPSPAIRRAPFLLGYTVKAAAEEKSDKDGVALVDDKMTYHLVKAEDIYVIDNSNYGRMFPVKRAPPESDLEDFYVLLGSQYISKAVDRRFEVVGSPKTETELTNALQERLRERGPLLVSPIVTSRPLVSGAAAILDEKRLDIYQATNLMAVFTLGKISRRNRTTCFSRNMGGKKNRIFVTSDLDMFDAGMAVGDLILKRCQLEDAFFISSLLEAPLEQLRARGFPVDRIIKQPEPVVVPQPAPRKPPPPTAAAAVPAAANAAPPNTTPTPATATNGAADQAKQEKPSEHSTVSETNKTDTAKADILCNMFPDADRHFVEAALGSNPSVDDVRSLAEDMAAGKYPKSDDHSEAATEATSSSVGLEKKKKSMRKRLGRAFHGLRGSNTEGGLTAPGQSIGSGVGVGGGVAPPGSTRHEESREPVPPAADARTQESLDRMLENSVNSTSRVQQRDIDNNESKLTSIPQELDRGLTCEVIPGHSLKPFIGPRGNGKTHNGIVVFSSKKHPSSEVFLAENEVSLKFFAEVLENLCVKVFDLKLDSIAIYHDPAGTSIAFNQGRSLHFNFRFFHALHFLQNKHQTSECYSYWYVTQCHELSHNFVSAHNREHGFYTEAFSTKYFPKLAALLRSLTIE